MRRDLQKILDATHDAMIAVDEDGIITIFNKSAEKLTKTKATDAVGRVVTQVIASTRLPFILKTGTSELNQQQPLNDITIITNRMPVIDDDGKIIGAIAVFRDVTEIHELAEKITNLDKIKETMEATIRATQDAISVVDEHGIGTMINPAYTRLTGYTEQDIIGKDCRFDLAEGSSIHMEVLRTRQPVKSKRLKVGQLKKEVIAEAAPILVKGELKGSVAVVHDLTELHETIKELEEAKNIIRKLEAKYYFEDIKGNSARILHAIEKAKVAAQTPATVLLRGESGTGKELFAHAIHNSSSRKYSQFVRVNCAAINENLLESELFGYEPGAFTGARKEGKVGLFEKANRGTIFLDEIGEMSMNTQVKLLRVIQEKEVMRVGGNKTINVDVRIIAATNVDLEAHIKNKTFRQDLFYRINVVPIEIPPLRERKEDIQVIIPSLISKFNQEYGRSVNAVSSEFLKILKEKTWPGNVRELENFIGRAMINVKLNEMELSEQHLSSKSSFVEEAREATIMTEDMLALSEAKRAFEKEYIEKILKVYHGNREQAAKALGISLRSLYYKLK